MTNLVYVSLNTYTTSKLVSSILQEVDLKNDCTKLQAFTSPKSDRFTVVMHCLLFHEEYFTYNELCNLMIFDECTHLWNQDHPHSRHKVFPSSLEISSGLRGNHPPSHPIPHPQDPSQSPSNHWTVFFSNELVFILENFI